MAGERESPGELDEGLLVLRPTPAIKFPYNFEGRVRIQQGSNHLGSIRRKSRDRKRKPRMDKGSKAVTKRSASEAVLLAFTSLSRFVLMASMFLYFVYIVLIILWTFVAEPLLSWTSDHISLVRGFFVVTSLTLLFLFFSKRSDRNNKNAEKPTLDNVDNQTLKRKRSRLNKRLDSAPRSSATFRKLRTSEATERRNKERYKTEEDGKGAGLEHNLKRMASDSVGTNRSSLTLSPQRQRENLADDISKTIWSFWPSEKHSQEYLYQYELYNYLKSKFPQTKIEEQKGASRPDIVIDNVAIEVKGPTRSRDLQTIADKYIRYRQHFDEVIVVLFDLRVKERYYWEWETALKKAFPKIRIILKSYFPFMQRRLSEQD